MTWNPDQPEPDDSPDVGLPMATLEWVWNSIGVRYGHFFAGKWDGFDLSIVKEDWRYQLGGLTDRQLQFGLDNLPVGRPPNDCAEYREICLRAPAPVDTTPRLPMKRGPVEIPSQVREQFDKLREPVSDEPPRVRWARDYVAKWGEAKVLPPVHKAALEAARKVLRVHDQAQHTALEPKEEGSAVPPDWTLEPKEESGAVPPSATPEH